MLACVGNKQNNLCRFLCKGYKFLIMEKWFFFSITVESLLDSHQLQSISFC